MDDNGEYSFGLCLSHDVDRVYKTYQYLYRFITRRDPSELAGMFSWKNPYWQFERIMSLESDLGVRSSFNVLDEMHISERPKSEWVTKSGWMLYAGGYDVTDPQLASTLRVLADHGWEIALQGSYTSSADPWRFGYEKDRIESAAETRIIGNRQHHWNLSRPETWNDLRNHGIRYDTSLGSSSDVDFQHGYELLRPFDDEFVVFPWSLMDGAVMDSGESVSDAWSNAKAILEEAREERSVIVADWHQRVFFDDDFPGWGRMYRRLVETALDMGAWVGPPGTFYRATTHPSGTVGETLDTLAEKDDRALEKEY